MSSTGVSEAALEVQFDNAKAYLMQADQDGVSAYDQLTRLMEVLLDENPQNVAGNPSKLHEILGFIQTHSFAFGEVSAPCNEAPSVPAEELLRLEGNKKLFNRPEPKVRTVIEQPDSYTTITTTTVLPLTAPSFESVVSQNKYWTAAGCGMAPEDAFLLDRSITTLAMEKGLQDIQFAGRIFGTQGDYFVLRTRRYVEAGETVYAEVNVMPKPPRKNGIVPVQAEPAYVGVNRYTYWVTAAPSDAWTKLPDVTPQQINAARGIKRFFTGDLTAAVCATFPWSEVVYLRAQLARITSGTSIAPQGALEEPEPPAESEEDEDAEDGAAARKAKEAKYRPLAVPAPDYGEEEVDVAQLTTDRWVHAGGYIYKNGRETKVPEKPEPEEEEEEEEPTAVEPEEDVDAAEEDEEAMEEEEEKVELFAPIQNDYLYGVVDIPQPPPVAEDDEEDEELEEEVEEEATEKPPGEPDNAPLKPLRNEDVPEDDTTKLKIASWTMRVSNNVSRAHRVAVVQSLRWPGATAFAAEGGKKWGCVYFGNGLKKTDAAYTPPPVAPVQTECADVVEVSDPTATVEKLVRRGEEVPEPDSEADANELEEEEDS